ncbi:MAG: diguanylate cyclase [Sneathiellaceae bacterium]
MTQADVRFLVVEDEPTSAAIVKSVLETLGEVVLAADAAGALEALQAFVPDAILLDISLPDLDGHALLNRIRSLPNLEKVPVIFVTAKDAPADQIRGLDQGALDYLVKPIAPAVLHARMKHHLQRLAEERRVRRLADFDDLTGLHNRRRFLEGLAIELERARRYGRTLSFVAFDLDHFKSINDRHGHDVGDAVLQAVGKVLRKRLRNVDLSGRLGGEEFGILLPETGLDGARCVAEKLRADIAATQVGDPRSPVSATASFGIACLRAGDDSDSLRKRADEALYEAKDGGRNRVCGG